MRFVITTVTTVTDGEAGCPTESREDATVPVMPEEVSGSRHFRHLPSPALAVVGRARRARCISTCFARRLRALLLFAPLLLGGCGGLLHTHYTTPEVALPQKWQGETVTGSAVASGEKWWQDFHDPVLSDLIERALRSNNDLSVAAIKVRRAQLSARLTNTNRTPSVSVAANSSISRDLKNHVDTRQSDLTGTVSYELDLWGKLARLRDAARFEAEATEEDRQSAALSLIGTTAADYWQIAFLNQRIETSRGSIAYAEKILELVQVKYDAGAVSAQDLVQAKQTIASQRAELAQLLRQLSEAKNALAILFDQAPENSVPDRQQLTDSAVAAVEAGSPASVLARRPDLRGAELRLRKYLATVDSTRASYYPSFTLTGSLGSSSTSLLKVLENPFAALGAGLALPFIQYNTMEINVEIAKADYQEAVVSFRQALYSALADVENALAARTRLEEENRAMEESLALARRAEELAEVRYRMGSTALQAWLDTQESRRSAEKALAENRLNRLRNQMSLYQALGGGLGDGRNM